eukprot:467734-Pleurochrysis_carterae.AAC.1
MLITAASGKNEQRRDVVNFICTRRYDKRLGTRGPHASRLDVLGKVGKEEVSDVGEYKRRRARARLNVQTLCSLAPSSWSSGLSVTRFGIGPSTAGCGP